MLYEPGAPTPEDVIPLCVPHLGGNEHKYVRECLDTNWVSSAGPFVNRFERMAADYVGAKHAVATVNGTAALHIALIVAGVQPDDEVLTPTLTFISPANAVRYIGAWPVFIDAEPKYWQIDAEKILSFLNEQCSARNGTLYNKATDRRVRAILPVHILGHPCDMEPILEVARRYDLTVIEDAAESLGAKYKGRMAGHLSDIACLSFNGNKIITTGGGGMIVTDNEEWAHKARYLTTQAKDEPLEYVHNEIGYNYRLTNIHAALGCAQMEQIGHHVAAKRRIAAQYAAALKNTQGITTMLEAPWAFSTFWMWTVLVSQPTYGIDSRVLLERLNEHKIQARPLWQPLHHSKAHSACQSYRTEVADRLYRDALSLPSSVGLSQQDLEAVCAVIT